MSGLRGAIVPVTPFQQNCAILWDDDSKAGMVIDPGGDVDRILAAIEQTGANDREDRADAWTSGSRRRRGRLCAMRCRPGPAARCRSRGLISRDEFLLDGIADQAAAYGFEARNVTPDRWLTEGESLTLGPHRFDVLHCPGHTPGSLVFVNTAARFAVVGDVLFQGRSGAPISRTATTPR